MIRGEHVTRTDERAGAGALGSFSEIDDADDAVARIGVAFGHVVERRLAEDALLEGEVDARDGVAAAGGCQGKRREREDRETAHSISYGAGFGLHLAASMMTSEDFLRRCRCGGILPEPSGPRPLYMNRGTLRST